MKSGRWLALFGCVFAIVLMAGMMAACGGTTSTTTGTEGAPTTAAAADVPLSILECPQGPVSGETPRYGGTLKITYDHTPSNLGAFWDLTRFLDWVQARFAVEGLVGLNPQGQPVPQLATSWDIDDVAKTITFHLREGVKFHDGTDFNAEAAKWNLDMQKNGPKTELKNVTSIDVVDPYTVRLTFSEMDPLFVQQMVASMSGKITSPAAYELYGPEAIKFQPVGTGPFRFDTFEPDVLLRYTRFEDYWQEGLPYLDAVEIHYIADNTVALTSFKSGEAQIMGNLGVKDVPELEAAGNTIQAVIHTGGGARSVLWSQIKADIYQKPVHTLAVEEGGVLGSALLAMVAAGVYPDVPAAVSRCVQMGQTFQPHLANAARYDYLFGLFKDLHDRLQAPFDRLAEMP